MQKKDHQNSSAVPILTATRVVRVKPLNLAEGLPEEAEYAGWIKSVGLESQVLSAACANVAGVVYFTLNYLMSHHQVEFSIPLPLSPDSLQFLVAEVCTLAREGWDPNLPFFLGQSRAALEEPSQIPTGAEHGINLLMRQSTTDLQRAC